jgi:predicted nuclease with TOPRIM domain
LHSPQNEKLQTALSEASAAISEVQRLEAEGGTLKSKLLRLDLDLAHARAHKDILGSRVEELEKVVDGLRTDVRDFCSSLRI